MRDAFAAPQVVPGWTEGESWRLLQGSVHRMFLYIFICKACNSIYLITDCDLLLDVEARSLGPVRQQGVPVVLQQLRAHIA